MHGPISRIEKGKFAFEISYLETMGTMGELFILRFHYSMKDLVFREISSDAVSGVTLSEDIRVSLGQDKLSEVADCLAEILPAEIGAAMKLAQKGLIPLDFSSGRPVQLPPLYVEQDQPPRKPRGNSFTEALCREIEKQKGWPPTVIENRWDLTIRMGKEEATLWLIDIKQKDSIRPGVGIPFTAFRPPWFKESFQSLTWLKADPILWKTLLKGLVLTSGKEEYPVGLLFAAPYTEQGEDIDFSDLSDPIKQMVGADAFKSFLEKEMESILPKEFSFLYNSLFSEIVPKNPEALKAMIQKDEKYQQAVESAKTKIQELKELIKDKKAFKDKVEIRLSRKRL